MRVGYVSILRIIICAIALLVVRIAVSFVVAGFPGGDEHDAQLVLQYVTGYALDATVVIIVFARFARVQPQPIFLHSFFVVLLQESLGAALISLLGLANPKTPLWLLDWMVLALSVFLGVWIGRRLKQPSPSQQ